MTRKKNYISLMLVSLLLILAGLHPSAGAAESISVQALVDRENVTVGESFLLQIKIDGDDAPAEPDLAGLQDFSVQPQGGGQNNRESITIINGKINRISEHGYVFRYLLTPKRDGVLTIPALEITAGGKTLLTQPIAIRVAKPVVTDEFRLRLSLPAAEAYVGQPLILTIKWYVNTNIAEFRFDLPFLEDNRFIFADLPEDVNYKGQDGITVNLADGPVIARKGQEGQYTTVTLRKVLIPRAPGDFALGRGSVFSKVITGYQPKRSAQPYNDFFNRDFFDDVFGRRQAVYRQLVTESNDLAIKILSLPAENRPHDFTGLVGQYSLAADADPTEVNVGDPITLHIMVTGTEYLGNVVLPPLENQPGMRDNFKVPEEMGPGEIDGRVKVFTQTIRAKNPAVKEIPAIHLAYFNPVSRQYESAATQPIPLRVNAARIVTAKDAEGGPAGSSASELTSLNRGIAYNYTGEDILNNQEFEIGAWLNSPAGLALVLLPPAGYLLVLLPVYIRRRRLQNLDSLQARRAFPEFSRHLALLQKDISQHEPQKTASAMVEAMRIYFASRLQLPPGALVYAEVAEKLQLQRVSPDLLAELKKILDRCEAYHYGARDRADSSREDLQEMLAAGRALFQQIDQGLKN